MFYVYILQSENNLTFYKGQTNDLSSRLKRHYGGHEEYTSRFRPWRLVWYDVKPTRAEAMKLERKLKNLSKDRIIKFIHDYPTTSMIKGLDVLDLLDQSRDAD